MNSLIQTIRQFICWRRTRHVYEILDKMNAKMCLCCHKLEDYGRDDHFQAF